MKEQFKGILPAIITPFTKEGHLDRAGLKKNIARWNECGLQGYVVLGSTGEAPLLSDEEKKAIIKITKQTIATEMCLVAGTGQESTAQTIKTTQMAAEAGAEVALVITPWFYKPLITGNVLENHYLAVAEASTIPIFLYNMPKFSGVTIPPDTVSKLAEHPNIVGIKDSSGNIPYLSTLIRNTPTEFIVLTGNAPSLTQALIGGATGAILAIANVAPKLCVALYKGVQAENLKTVQNLQQKLQLLSEVAGGTYGIGGLKQALTLLNYAAGLPRSPLPPATTAQLEKIKAICQITLNDYN